MHPLGRGLRRLAGAVALLLLLLAVGFAWYLSLIPQEPSSEGVRTDAIVVLTGGSDRVATGVDLLRRGLADRLFISGVPPQVRLSELLDQAGYRGDAAACCIVLGRRAEDTLGNARETADWVRRRGLRSIRIVTAHYHMPRSLLIFQHALPEVTILPHPVFPAAVKADRWWRWPGTARLLLQEYAKLLAALLWTALPDSSVRA